MEDRTILILAGMFMVAVLVIGSGASGLAILRPSAANIKINQQVLTMLNKCENLGAVPLLGITCTNICIGHGTCIFSKITYKSSNDSTIIQSGIGSTCLNEIKQSMLNRGGGGVSISCTCCKP